MVSFAQAKLRAGLLTKAIECCTSLSDVLDKIEPSRFIKPSSDRLDAANTALLELYQLEDTLRHKLLQLQEHRNNTLNPLSRLNDDILRYIFKMRCVPPDGIGGITWESQAIGLSHVCRRWRIIALDTASLWACALFHPGWGRLPGPDTHPSLRHKTKHTRLIFEERTAALLRRSKGSLLTVEIHMSAQRAASIATEQFLAHCPNRVQHLKANVSITTEEQFKRCLSAITSTLRKLHLSMDRHNATITSTAMTHLLSSNLPLLQELTLADVHFPTHFGNETVVFAACRKLVLLPTDESQSFSAHTFSVLLRCCPELRDLTVAGSVTLDASPVPEGRVCLENLEVYSVRVPVSTCSIFAVVKAPRLVTLEIALYPDLDLPANPVNEDTFASYVTAVRTFLEASSPSLQTLYVDGVPGHHLQPILLAAPNIERFTLSDAWRSGLQQYAGLLSSMGCPVAPSETPVCPRLKTLICSGTADAEILTALIQMVASRKGSSATARIRAIHLSSALLDRPGELQEQQRVLHRELAEELDSLYMDRWKLDLAADDWIQWTDSSPFLMRPF